MKNMFHLVKKNLKLLMRSRTSALIVILGPLLVIFLAGLAFDNSKTYSISLGSYSESYNELSSGFLTTLEENEFSIIKYDNEEACANAIKEGAIHSCLVFSPNFELGNNAKNEIVFYVDYSKINLVYMVLETMSTQVSQKSSELSINLTTVLLDTLDSTKNEIVGRKSTITTLSEKNTEANKKLDETKTKLESMDVSTDVISSVSTSDLTLRKNQIATQISSLEGAAEDAIDEARSLIEDVEDAIDSSSLEAEEKSYIMSLLNDSGDELNDVEESFEDDKNTTSQRLDSLSAAISNVSAGVEDAKDKLSEAGDAKTASISNLVSAKKTLDEALAKITELQNSFNSIESSINSVKVTDASNIVNPVTTTIKPVVGESTHLNYIFPVLIVLVLMFTGILLSTTLIMLEKKTTAYFRNFISPTKDITFISATFLTCIILLLVQVVVIMGLSAIFFGSHIFTALPKTLPILFLCMSLFTLAGMLVGYVFNSEETATLGAISVGSVFLLLSDVILPIESMSPHLFNIAQYNPFVLGSSLLRKAIIHNVPFTSIEHGLLYLFFYCAVVFALVVFVQSVTKKHYISKFLRNIAAKPEHYKKKANK